MSEEKSISIDEFKEQFMDILKTYDFFTSEESQGHITSYLKK